MERVGSVVGAVGWVFRVRVRVGGWLGGVRMLEEVVAGTGRRAKGGDEMGAQEASGTWQWAGATTPALP